MSTPLRALHDRLLVLPNAWDAASARLLGHRFPAVGTTSLGVAAAAGLPDGTGAAREETLRLARLLRERAFLLTVDIEGGFAGVEDYVAELGAEGINVEDGRGDRLCPVDEHVAHIEAIKRRCPEVFVNARTDGWWLGVDAAGTLERVRAYVAAGADGVFVPRLPDEQIVEVAAAAGVPLNVLARPGGLSPGRLEALGARRLSTGSLLYRRALTAALAAAEAVAGGHAVPEGARLRRGRRPQPPLTRRPSAPRRGYPARRPAGTSRRGAGVVERGGLENRCTGPLVPRVRIPPPPLARGRRRTG
jgi:2-methylisocitrate lyase-like PEP mutase family enzyme